MKILLIDPPFKSFAGFYSFYFPLGLAYLSSVCKKAGYTPIILDMDVLEGKSGDLVFTSEYERYKHYVTAINDLEHNTWKTMQKIIHKLQPDFIGITAMTTKFGSVIQTARICKKILPNIPVIVGGPHATAMPDLTMKVDEIDFVIRGEAEETLPKLIKAISSNQDISQIPGVSWRKNGKVIHNKDASFIQNLDIIPLPDRYSFYNSNVYSSEDMGVMLTSRGCPFRCSYCFNMWNRKVRFRSISSVIEEIREVHKNFETTQFAIKDDSFTVKKSHVISFCEELLKEPYKINWSCTTRVDIIDEELIKLMKKAGCNLISIGVETGSAKILEEIDKDITFNQVIKAAKLLNKHNIFWSAYFMIGLPTETEDDILKTIKFLRVINPFYAGLGVYNPFPNTKLFEQGVKLGLLNPKPDITHFLSTHPKDLFFIDPSKRVLNLSPNQFANLANLAFNEFYKHNTKILNLLRRGLARHLNYMNHPSLLFRDIKKALELLGIIK